LRLTQTSFQEMYQGEGCEVRKAQQEILRNKIQIPLVKMTYGFSRILKLCAQTPEKMSVTKIHV
jgi:hypothetical protein